MKKNQFIKVLAYCLTALLLSLGMSVQTSAMDFQSPINTTPNSTDKPGTVKDITEQAIGAQLTDLKNTSLEQNTAKNAAINAVDALFIDNKQIVLNTNVRQADIIKARTLVNAIPASPLNKYLNWLLMHAQHLLQRQKVTQIVDALYRNKAHTVIRHNLNQADITRARSMLKKLGSGKIETKLQILILIAQRELNYREAIYALFSDKMHTKIKNDLTQTDVDNLKELVDSLADQWPIKVELNQLLVLAQHQLDEKNSKADSLLP